MISIKSVLLCSLLIFVMKNISVEAKKSKKKFRRMVYAYIPTEKASIKKSSLELLHKKRRYDRSYLSEYRKMISNLLPQSLGYSQFASKEFLPLRLEAKTLKTRYSKEQAKIVDCVDLNANNQWITMKTLQLEDKNSVTLKQDVNTGEKVVEKLMEGKRHYDKEITFYKLAHHGSTRYFPKIICASKAAGKNSRFSIVTDYIEGEKSHIMAAVATWDQLRFMVAQLFNSLIELHKVGFVHCDLSPANVMVTRKFDVKLIDFGMAMPVGSATGYRGSTYTRAPELHEMCPGKIDVSIDWWAFGATVSIWYFYHYNPQLIHDKDGPTYHFTPMKLHKKRYFTANEYPAQFPDDLRKLLSLFLTIDPELRTFSTERLQNMVRSHEFFNGFDWSTAEKS